MTCAREPAEDEDRDDAADDRVPVQSWQKMRRRSICAERKTPLRRGRVSVGETRVAARRPTFPFSGLRARRVLPDEAEERGQSRRIEENTEREVVKKLFYAN